MKFTARVATTNPDQDGDVFTPEALQQLADTAVGKGVSIEFTHRLPGWTIDRAAVVGDAVIVQGTGFLLTDDLREKLNGMFVVPGYLKRADGRMELTSVALTNHPADDKLTPISELIEPLTDEEVAEIEADYAAYVASQRGGK